MGIKLGIFDSGIGGLTILNPLVKQRVDLSFTYLADHQYCPYGGMSAEDILARTLWGVSKLSEMGCGMIIIACNTASIQALPYIQQNYKPELWPDLKLLGIFVPTIEILTGMHWQRDWRGEKRGGDLDIAIWATDSTIASKAYSSELQKRIENSRIIEQSAAELAGLIETAWGSQELDRYLDRLVDEYYSLCDGQPTKRILLACTHYSWVKPILRRKLPQSIDIVSQPDLIASSLGSYCLRHDIELSCERDQVFASSDLKKADINFIQKTLSQSVRLINVTE